MASLASFFAPDLEQRRRAIDPTASFMVQAPAGSGKTELLIQRFLQLLSVVDRPESIVAITFTRKAAGEMLDRILQALRRVQEGQAPETSHEQFTSKLAQEVLRRDQELGWNLLENPGRLRVQTIDSLCISIVSQMPWLARMGAVPQIEENAESLYYEAARRTLLRLEEDGPFQSALETTLLHLDNNTGIARKLLADMLASRDQWIELTYQVDDDARPVFEAAMTQAVSLGLEAAENLIPFHVKEAWLQCLSDQEGISLEEWPTTDADYKEQWIQLVDVVLTQAGAFRKKNPVAMQLSRVNGLESALVAIRSLPLLRYSESQWEVLRSLLDCLKLAVADLRIVFNQTNTVDFTELGLAARTALGSPDAPSDLAFRMDARIHHLLVDEFQDTSVAQYELLHQLTSEWQYGDGRTLFLVGDPMQSIYRFRQAEVGLFLNVRERGISQIQPESLQLVANYRSRQGIVDWVNECFSRIFPQVDDISSGAVTYSPSESAPSVTEAEVTIHAFAEKQENQEADKVVQLVQESRMTDPEGTVAILVGARTHLPSIVKALRDAGFRFRALEIDPLGSRMVVRDLLSLTRAMLHPGDRISWLAVLRAPWCGLDLSDLHALVSSDLKQPIWERLQNPENLSDDGKQRVMHFRQILEEAFQQQGRWTLRRWVERTWNALGGPACLSDESELQDVYDFLDLLEREQQGSDLHDFDAFSERVNQLFAQPDNRAEDWLHVMTIHKAKGLQFDTVILPGLGRKRRNDDDRLFFFHQWMDEAGEWERLMAPISEVGGEKDPSYDYLRKIEKKKGDHERVRLFYVATTRAKRALHLLGHVRANQKEGVKPESSSMLADLWPALSEEDRKKFHQVSFETENANSQTRAANILKRLPPDWKMPVLPEEVSWKRTVTSTEEIHQPDFDWVSDRLRHVGSAVHLFFQQIARKQILFPDQKSIRQALIHLGISKTDLDFAVAQVQTALQNARMSKRAQWILDNHEEDNSEYSITGVVDGAVVRGIIDRTFVDGGIRWIIDYKTSSHQGGDLICFLDEQQRRYRDQLNRYGKLLSSLGLPVRLGLYFPLLDEWREWGLEDSL